MDPDTIEDLLGQAAESDERECARRQRAHLSGMRRFADRDRRRAEMRAIAESKAKGPGYLRVDYSPVLGHESGTPCQPVACQTCRVGTWSGKEVCWRCGGSLPCRRTGMPGIWAYLTTPSLN
jgi:hypothetical protein